MNQLFNLSSRQIDRSVLLAWARLVRIPAVFTVIAQVAAAFLYVAHDAQPTPRLILVIFAAILLYWSGMILNDLWDLEEDTRERRSRPLPSGEVSLPAATTAAWGMMIGGVALATLSGFLPSQKVGNTVCPASVSVAIAISVLLYNGPLKQTWLAPLTMGLCRSLCFLLGAAPLMTVASVNNVGLTNWLMSHVVAAALGMGVYIMGITLISSSETVGGRKTPIVVGTAIMVLGVSCMAMSPQLAPQETMWTVSLEHRFALLIGLVACPVVVRGVRVAMRPEADAIQRLVRIGVLTLIPFSAAFAMLAAGTIWGLMILTLVVPAFLSAAKIRVT